MSLVLGYDIPHKRLVVGICMKNRYLRMLADRKTGALGLVRPHVSSNRARDRGWGAPPSRTRISDGCLCREENVDACGGRRRRCIGWL